VAALLVRQGPERGLEAEGSAAGFLFIGCFFLFRHDATKIVQEGANCRRDLARGNLPVQVG